MAQPGLTASVRGYSLAMTLNLATTRLTRAQLLAAFGKDHLSPEALLAFCALPPERLALIKDLAQPEVVVERSEQLPGWMRPHATQ